jgi:hypothetical protein
MYGQKYDKLHKRTHDWPLMEIKALDACANALIALFAKKQVLYPILFKFGLFSIARCSMLLYFAAPLWPFQGSAFGIREPQRGGMYQRWVKPIVDKAMKC